MERPTGSSRRWGRSVSLLLIAGLAAGCSFYVWQQSRAAAPATVSAKDLARSQPVRVTLATAAQRDVPVVLNGLGTVQASQTVNIHARVDGILDSVGFTEGQNVKAGDVLARLDPRLAQAALDQAQAAKTKDEAQLRGAQADLTRYTALVQKDYASRQSLDQQQATVDQLKAALVADDAAIETARTNLDYTVITAPVDGRMGLRQLDAGNIVHSGDATPIAVLTTLQPISVVFSLPENDLEAVQSAAARGPVAARALRDDGTVIDTGTLAVLDNQVDAGTATLKLKATFPNREEKLWPGAFVHVALDVDMVKNAVTVPVAAVQRGPDGLFAWVVGPDETARVTPILTGRIGDGVAVVERGLKAGDRVVVNGQYRLRPDARVVAAESAGDGEGNAGKASGTDKNGKDGKGKDGKASSGETGGQPGASPASGANRSDGSPAARLASGETPLPPKTAP